MRRYLYFDMADAPFLQQRLDRLADRGLELTSTKGFFSGEFERTTRRDLRYLVLPYGNASCFPRFPERYIRYGYQLVGGFNGMAIFKPIPCANCDPEGLHEAFRDEGSLHEKKHGVWLVSLFWLAFAVICCVAFSDQLLNVMMLTSYSMIALTVFLSVLVVGALVSLFTLKRYVGGWVHGSATLAEAGGILLVLVGFLLDQRGSGITFAVLSIGCAVALFCGFWRKNRVLSASCAGIFLLVLLVGLLAPDVQRSDTTHALHNEAQSLPVLQLDDYWEGEELQLTELSTDGTVLIRIYSYTEVGSEHSLSCTAYRCASVGLADRLLEYLLEAYPAYSSSTETAKAVAQSGNVVWLVDGSDALPIQ